MVLPQSIMVVRRTSKIPANRYDAGLNLGFCISWHRPILDLGSASHDLDGIGLDHQSDSGDRSLGRRQPLGRIHSSLSRNPDSSAPEKGISSPFAKIWISVTFWCLLEWLWTQSPLWWTALSYTQSPSNTWILHLGQLSGPSLISTVIVTVNALWAEAYRAVFSSNTPSSVQWRSLSKLFQAPQAKSFSIGAIGLFITAHIIGGILSFQPLTQDPNDAIKIGIIQGNIPTRIKLFPQGLDRAFKDYLDGYKALVADGAEAVLMPEGAFPTKWSPGAARYKPLISEIQKDKAIAWIGAFMPTGSHITQSLVTVTPENSQYSQYDKVKLVPLGEYLPLEDSLGKIISRLTPLSYRMIPGRTDQLMDTPFGKAVISICYDSAFPQLLRRQTAEGGQFILSVANNDPYSARMMAQHHAQDVMRAIENDRWVARATNTGLSSVITPHGQTEWRSQRNRYETYLTTIQKRESRTLYVQWGSWILGMQVITSLLLLSLKSFSAR